MTFSANSQIRLNSRFEDPDNLGPGVQTVNTTYSVTLSDGTAAGQADLQYANTETLAASAVFNVDLTTVENAFGDALAAAEVVQIVIASASTNTTDLTIGGSAADFAGLPDQTIAPGGGVCLWNTGANGLGTVTDGSSDTIRITNGSGASATVDIYVVARSA